MGTSMGKFTQNKLLSHKNGKKKEQQCDKSHMAACLFFSKIQTTFSNKVKAKTAARLASLLSLISSCSLLKYLCMLRGVSIIDLPNQMGNKINKSGRRTWLFRAYPHP